MKKVFLSLLILGVVLFLKKTSVQASFCTRSGSNTNCVDGKIVNHSWTGYNCPDCEKDENCKEIGVEDETTNTACGGGNNGGGNNGGGNNGGENNGGGAVAPVVPAVPACVAKTAKSASIEPDIVNPWRDVLVRCGYGEDLDCVGVTGGGLSNCTVRAYVNNETIFACKAGGSPGVYTDAKCVLSAGTAGNCCAGAERAVGQYSVLSTAAHFSQRMRLPTGSYTLSVKEYTTITKGNGAFVDVLCASPDCGGGIKENGSVALIPFSVNSDFEIKTVAVSIPAEGNNKDYKVRIVAGEGSELYVSSISLSGGGKEYVLNGDFKNVRQTPNAISINQPNGWTDASNRLGYYYGMAMNTNIPVSTSATGGSSTSQGSSSGTGGSTKLTLKLKLQGVAKKPIKADSIIFKVKLTGKQTPPASESKSISFSVADDGTWTGAGDFSTPAGEGYTLFVKGPKHLQKKVCDMVPTETTGGVYRCTDGKISLKTGDNTIDLTKIIMLVGDLPEKGVQNGIIDPYDTSYVRQHLQSTKSEELVIGDLNYDGVIDGQDYSLSLAALSIKYDEE